jgi:hypothetical protein
VFLRGYSNPCGRQPGSIPQLTTFGIDNAGELYAGTSGGRVYKLAP